MPRKTNKRKPKQDGINNPNKYKKLKAMHCYKQMYDKLCAGIVPEEVARWIQEDMLERLDVKRESLVRELYKFKAEIPIAERKQEQPLYVKKAIEKLKRGINELEELEALYLLQLRRISIDAQTEEKINKLFSNTSKEIALARDILKDMFYIKQQLGLVQTQPQRIEVSTSFVNLEGGKVVDEEKLIKFGVVAEKMLTAILNSDDEDMKEAVETIVKKEKPKNTLIKAIKDSAEE